MKYIVLIVWLCLPFVCQAQYTEFLFFKNPNGNVRSVLQGEYYEEVDTTKEPTNIGMHGYEITHYYDSAGRIYLTCTETAVYSDTNYHTYDAQGRIKHTHTVILFAGGPPRRHELEMTYKWLTDDRVVLTRFGERDTVSVTSTIKKNVNGLITEVDNDVSAPIFYAYDDMGNLVRTWQQEGKNVNTMLNLQYLEYDKHGNPTKARILDRVRRREPTVRVYKYTYK